MNKNKPESQVEPTAPVESATELDEETTVKFLQVMFLRYQAESREAESLRKILEAQNGR